MLGAKGQIQGPSVVNAPSTLHVVCKRHGELTPWAGTAWILNPSDDEYIAVVRLVKFHTNRIH